MLKSFEVEPRSMNKQKINAVVQRKRHLQASVAEDKGKPLENHN